MVSECSKGYITARWNKIFRFTQTNHRPAVDQDSGGRPCQAKNPTQWPPVTGGKGGTCTYQSSIPNAHKGWSWPHLEGPHRHSGTKLRQRWQSSSGNTTEKTNISIWNSLMSFPVVKMFPDIHSRLHSQPAFSRLSPVPLFRYFTIKTGFESSRQMKIGTWQEKLAFLRLS